MNNKNQSQSLNKHQCLDRVLRVPQSIWNDNELKKRTIAVLRSRIDFLSKTVFIKRQRNPSAAKKGDMIICFKSWVIAFQSLVPEKTYIIISKYLASKLPKKPPQKQTYRNGMFLWRKRNFLETFSTTGCLDLSMTLTASSMLKLSNNPVWKST